MDWGPVAGGYLGTFGLGAALLAMTTLASLLGRDQLVAAVLGIIFTVGTFLMGWSIYSVWDVELRQLLLTFHLYHQFTDYARGLVDSRYLLFDGTLIVALLALCHRMLLVRRWL